MNPEQFLDAVTESVANQLSSKFAELKAELMRVVAAKNLGNIPESRIDQACQQIHEKTKENFDKNMEKFRIYAMRNVFVPATSASAATSSSSSTGTETDRELLQLREKYLALQATYQTISDSARETDMLLKDMRTALFTLRVGAQVFQDGDIEQIGEQLAGIVQNKNRLLEMCDEANNIMAQFGESEEASASAASTEAMEATSPELAGSTIETGNTSDILALGRSLKGK